jgi:uncharacterized Fe-S center protein
MDQAVLDLVQKKTGRTLESMTYPDRTAATMIHYAESLGLGTPDYQLEHIAPR